MNTAATPTITATAPPSTPATPTATQVVDVTATVDDVELLNILGLTSNANVISCNDFAVLDWDDMPELSAEEEDDEDDEDDKDSISSKNNKRKFHDVDDVFADLDFIEVPLLPATTTTDTTTPSAKKQKTFVDEEDESELLKNMALPPLDDDIRLALDMISSV
ncbi:uncharacterized protein ATC70_008618 [Mucor velutinosus]|uniref:Uncharacterized protein n=1 Tax=Mucor velutinosus TaxID=708070 RepID=A0AAN7DJ48_9FUNG|nr:hypothetical protein ATC70_008618 [Mucor velutinosus]